LNDEIEKKNQFNEITKNKNNKDQIWKNNITNMKLKTKWNFIKEPKTKIKNQNNKDQSRNLNK
jgi:hypothetical protein